MYYIKMANIKDKERILKSKGEATSYVQSNSNKAIQLPFSKNSDFSAETLQVGRSVMIYLK